MDARPIEEVAGTPEKRDRFSALLRRDVVAVIAEVKRSSPSQGPIRPKLDAAQQASKFTEGGASAISILTEPTRFEGSINDLWRATGTTSLPLLKKDFHTKPEHMVQAWKLGASAALLIVRAIPPAALRECMAAAAEVGIEVLVEVHRESELDLALELGATIVGVNARDLETLKMNPHAHKDLIPRVPTDVIAIAESGMSTRKDIERAADAGADAVLIGTSLSHAPDPGGLLRILTNVPRRTDVR